MISDVATDIVNVIIENIIATIATSVNKITKLNIIDRLGGVLKQRLRE